MKRLLVALFGCLFASPALALDVTQMTPGGALTNTLFYGAQIGSVPINRNFKLDSNLFSVNGSGVISLNVTSLLSPLYPWPVSSGGTGQATPSGSALDAISGLVGTGVLIRTGPGAYSFLAQPAGVLVGDTASQRLQNKIFDCLQNTCTNFPNGGGGGSGTVTNIATAGPITGGPITGTGTLNFDKNVLAISYGLTGLIKGNGASTFTAYAGTTCAPGGFTRSLDANATATCNQVNLTAAADVTGSLPLANIVTIGATTTLGNPTGGSAVPVAMTKTQATANLNPCVGDSGSGGTAGLAPAAGAGDAAANKFLAADCTYKVASGSGTVTSIPLGAGLTKTVGTENTGSDTITSTGTINMQLWPVLVASSCVVNSNCNGGSTKENGEHLIANAAAITFTAPNPGAGTKGNTYQFGSNGTVGLTLTTPGVTATFYGCSGGGGTSYVAGANVDVQIEDDGTNYKCTAVSSPIIPLALTWNVGTNPNNLPIANISTNRIIVGIRCTPEVLAGAAATVQPVKAASTVAISGGTNLTSTTCNANASAGTDQDLTMSVTTLAPGDRLGLKTTGTWTAASGLITVFVR